MKTTNMSDHLRTGSALVEFLADRLGAPDCWPDDCNVKPTVIRGPSNQTGDVALAGILTVAEHRGLVDKALSMNQQTTSI